MGPFSQCGVLAALAAVVSQSMVSALTIPRLHARVLDSPAALRESYDYIVVGAGPAGLTVGDRLSEDGKNTVLVIENGGLIYSDDINNIRDGPIHADPWWLYNISSAPNTELNNKSSWVYAASMVGGSSAINGAQVVRGTIEDYDRMGKFFGDNSIWSWEGMLASFKKAIHFQQPPKEVIEQMPDLKYDESYWGFTSRLFAGWPSFQWPGITFREVPGVEFPEDSGAGKTGVYWYPTYMDGVGSINRSYARTAHWDGINRDNYHLLTWSKVIRVELVGKKVTGVIFRPNTEDATAYPTVVKVDKEVVISAGTIHSPQILQLSGIGPQKLLESAGIETIVDLPGVGQHFHDHNTLNVTIQFKNFTIHPNQRDDYTDPDFVAWADELWAANRTGPWSNYLWNTGAWLSFPVVAPDEYESLAATVDAQNAADYLPPDTHPTVIAGYQARLATHAAALRSRDTVFYSHYFSGDEPVFYFTNEHILSAGSVNVNVSAPETEPIIDFRTYSNPVDFDITIAMARFHRRINEDSPVLAQFQPVEVSPGRDVTERKDWIAYIRDNTEPSAMHLSGTCAMMPLDLGGVVDEELRVYGVEGLRVVDASVLSVVPGANIAGTVFAIAEKTADLIRGVVKVY